MLSISPLTLTPAEAAGISGCRTGIVRRITGPGIPLRGTHVLIGLVGGVIASLRSDTISLDLFNNRLVTVCGIIEPPVEGVTPILVTRILPAIIGFPAPVPLRPRLRLQCFLVPDTGF